MTTRPEDLEKQKAIAEARRMAELRKQIVRAESWDQLFEFPEQEITDFIDNLVGQSIAEYKKNNSFKEHRVEPNPEGDIHIVETTTENMSDTFQKLNESRDVIITSNYPNEETLRLVVTYNVGNINHSFTRINTVIPSYKVLEQIGDEEMRRITGTHIVTFLAFSEGKPATEGWEEVMLYNGHLPQRIGLRIFPNFVLEAQAKLMKARPQLFSQK